TWKAHLVTLLFVFYTFLRLRPADLPAPLRVVLIGLWALIAVSGLSGRDLVGRDAYYYLGGYSVVVWTMLLLFVAAVVLVQREAGGTVACLQHVVAGALQDAPHGAPERRVIVDHQDSGHGDCDRSAQSCGLRSRPAARTGRCARPRGRPGPGSSRWAGPG